MTERQIRVFPKTEYVVMLEKRPIGYEITAVINHDRETFRYYPLTARKAHLTFDNLVRTARYFEGASDQSHATIPDLRTRIDNALALEHKPGAGKRDIIAALKGTDR